MFRKGDVLTRKCDGFRFIVTSASRKLRGAHLQCLDATRIQGWRWFDDIARDYTREARA